MALCHLDMVCEIKGENVGVREMRKQLAWYLKGLCNSNEIKNKINTIVDKNQIKRVLIEYLYELTS